VALAMIRANDQTLWLDAIGGSCSVYAMNRRTFLIGAGTVAVATAMPHVQAREAPPSPSGKARFRTGLVAYSYREAFKAKTFTYEDLIRVAVETGTDGIDMTVYWLPSTTADYLLSLRRLAYRNRVEIYSIGTRVQLAQPTVALRNQQLAELRQWLDVAQRVGATHVRVFGGDIPAGATKEQAVGFAAETLKRGAEEAGARGLILGIEDDGGITDYAKDTIAIVERAASPWAGMNLDIGNFRPPDVYGQVEMSIPYAVSTHVKTELTLDDGRTAPFDLERIFQMFAAHEFRGYMGLEYEAAGDPTRAVPEYLQRLRALAVKYSA
jgi:hydroxypyruvate isomerase